MNGLISTVAVLPDSQSCPSAHELLHWSERAGAASAQLEECAVLEGSAFKLWTGAEVDASIESVSSAARPDEFPVLPAAAKQSESLCRGTSQTAAGYSVVAPRSTGGGQSLEYAVASCSGPKLVSTRSTMDEVFAGHEIPGQKEEGAKRASKDASSGSHMS